MYVVVVVDVAAVDVFFSASNAHYSARGEKRKKK